MSYRITVEREERVSYLADTNIKPEMEWKTQDTAVTDDPKTLARVLRAIADRYDPPSVR